MQTSHAVPIPAPSYEFPTEHDASLTRTATWTRQLGLVSAVAAGFALFSGALPVAVAQAVIAYMLVRAAKHLRAIVQTSGEDVAHLADAAKHLARALRIRTLLVCIAMPVAAVGFFVGMFAKH